MIEELLNKNLIPRKGGRHLEKSSNLRPLTYKKIICSKLIPHNEKKIFFLRKRGIIGIKV
jgi:hypothetical protein